MNKVKALLASLRGVLYKLTHCDDCHKVDMCPFWHPRLLWAVIRHSDNVLVCRRCYKKRRRRVLAAGIALAPVVALYMLKKHGVPDKIKEEALKEQRVSNGSAK